MYNVFAEMPRVVGAIDCTQIPIKAPWVHPEQFVNRKQSFSISTQMVVNHLGHITHISARWPGSIHDSHILQESYLQDVLDANMLGNYYLIGDAGYACQLNLLTPYTQPQINDEKEIL